MEERRPEGAPEAAHSTGDPSPPRAPAANPLIPPTPDTWLHDANRHHEQQVALRNAYMAENARAMAAARVAAERRQKAASIGAVAAVIVAISSIGFLGYASRGIDFGRLFDTNGTAASLSDIPSSRALDGDLRPDFVAYDASRPPTTPLPTGSRLMPAVAPPPGEGGHEFISTNIDSTPIAFDPCRPIRYVVNNAAMPAGAENMVAESVAIISAATGLAFEFGGLTDEAPSLQRGRFIPESYGNVWAPLVIWWTSPADFEVLSGGVVGAALSDSETALTGEGVERQVLVTGVLALDGPEMAALINGYGEKQARAVVLHELGHVVGLDHTGDRQQIMFPEVQRGLVDLGDGDRQGLSALGAGPCFPML